MLFITVNFDGFAADLIDRISTPLLNRPSNDNNAIEHLPGIQKPRLYKPSFRMIFQKYICHHEKIAWCSNVRGKVVAHKIATPSQSITRTILRIAFLCLIALVSAACQSSPAYSPPAPFSETNHQNGQALNQKYQVLPPTEVRFNHLSLEEGLSHSTVTAILQDSQGFIWIGTLDGLNRFDGYDVTIFKNDPAVPTSLSANHVSALFEDGSGALWVGTEGGGLSRFDRPTEKFTNYEHDANDSTTLSNNFVQSLMEDSQGRLWVGTGNGLNQFDREMEQFTFYRIANPPPQITGGSNSITVISEDPAGTLWLGTPTSLLSFDPDSETFLPQVLIPLLFIDIPGEFVPVEVLTILHDDAGALWIGTRGDGLFQLIPKSGKVTQYLPKRNNPYSLSDSVVSAIKQDQTGSLWVGTAQGLDRLDRESQQFTHFQHDVSDDNSLSDSEVSSLYLDQAGILWVGTHRGGANSYDPYKVKFQHVGPMDGDKQMLSHPQVWTFFEDDQADLWVGTSAGLDRIQGKTGQTTHYLPESNDSSTLTNAHVTKILKDSQDNIWIATSGGLNRYDPLTDSFEQLGTNPDFSASLSSEEINDIYEDSYHRLWIAYAGAGLDRLELETNRLTHFRYQNGDSVEVSGTTNIVTTFFEDSNRLLWIGTLGGLLKYDPATESFSIFRHDPTNPASLASDVINAIHQDQRGVLWLATANGLDHLDPDTGLFSHYREEDGLPSNNVVGILEQPMGNLWLSTNRGLSRFDPKNETFRNFDSSDGLQSLEFNSGAYYQNDSGAMFFGGINGFNVFHPDDVRDNPYSTPIVLSELLIQNEVVSFGPDSVLTQAANQARQIELSRADTVLSLELAALHYGTPEENQYAYLLDGFDRDWNYTGERRVATYTNLPPGVYTFRAYGGNSDGVWGIKGLELAIRVPYPFWQTWWFAIIVTMILAGAIFGGYRLRSRSTLARTRELEEQVSVRTVEIERRRQIAEGLREIMVLINSNKSLEESLHYIVSQAAKLTDAEDAIIFRREENSVMNIIATNPGGQIRYSPNPGLSTITDKWAQADLLEKKPLIVPDLVVYWLANPEIRAGSFGSHRAMLGIPVIVDELVYGGLIMLFDHERSFSEEDQELGLTFADQATLAIANNHLRKQAEQIAVASERSRLARELHDAVTQTIFSASLIAETIPAIWDIDQEEGKNLLSDLRQLTRGALAEMRTLLLELRPTALEEANLQDLLHQLSESVGGRTGVGVITKVDEIDDLPVHVKVALYRIAQESLNNVIKHARATQIEIRLSGSEKYVSLVIQDNGRGFSIDAVPSDRFGLYNMRERSEAIDAILTVHSQPEEGTRIMVEWRDKDQDPDQVAS